MLKAVVALLALTVALFAQKPAAFDVAVIKPADLTHPQRGFAIAPGNRTLSVYGLTTGELIQRTYAIQESQVSGGPPWMNSERFDIVAKIERETPPTINELWKMLEQLLADRFALKFHRETRTLPGFALSQTNTGAKLNAAEAATPNLAVRRGQLDASRVSISMLVNALSRYLGRPVFDDTGLKGSYDFKMTWSPGETEQSLPFDEKAAPVDPGGPSIFTAMEDQLGLRLESRKVPIDVFVIDNVEKPSEN